MTMMQEVEELPQRLTKQDRCDRCKAQAFILAVNEKGHELFFCGHHGKKYFPELFKQGFVVHDETHLINSKSESSA